MREIKIRAWDNELKEMLYSKTEQFDDALMFRFNKHFETERPIFMQYTGLKDSKRTKEYPEGQEIYEGDYLRCKQYIGGNFVEYHLELGYVEFIYGSFGLHRKQGFYRPFKDWLEEYELEVLGNCWDNPDLLVDKQKAITDWNCRPDNWIPVTERLPGKSGPYLCWYKDGFGNKGHWVGYWDDGRKGFYPKWPNNLSRVEKYWMPLPEPPEQEVTP